ncbi:MAG: hypothetical protein C0629_16920 [Chromatiales bacterium]|nr:MAG: hypothetical protein C0629_16920 [Chromatiales bacterium]
MLDIHEESDMRYNFSGAVGVMLAALLVLGPAQAFAQVQEQEPNNTCLTAQAVGALAGLSTIVSGSLDTDYVSDPPVYDVDFYQVEATPGMRFRTELRGASSGVGTLGDPFLGLFASDCSLLAANDDSVLGLDSQIDFEVPADGVFILAATGCCDQEFIGAHGQEGSYELGILEAPAAIGSISGRVLDAVSGEPLSGVEPPYAFAELFRCSDAGCFNYVAFIPVEADGTFRIATDNDGNPLEAGSYLIAARADGFEPAEAGPFAVGAAEDFDVGDIDLSPPPVVFANVVPCADLPADGGVCRYTVDVRNNTRSAIRGLGWSNVQAFGTGSPLGFSFFPAQRDQFLRVPALSSRTLRFSFNVPAGVADGAFFCADGWFSDRETAFMGTLRNEFLFCGVKQFGMFRALDPKVAAGMLKAHGQNRGRGVKP